MLYPFQTEEYRKLYKKHFVLDSSTCVLVDNVEYELLPDSRAVLVGMKPVLTGQEITDFGDVEDRVDLTKIHTILHQQYKIATVQYDYVREGGSTYDQLSTLKSTQISQQEVSPVIVLPKTWEEYLSSLERTDRKELKRKWKRLETVSHQFITTDISQVDNYFQTFIKLHKMSDPNKVQFMTEEMESFFKDLYKTKIPNWEQKLAILTINAAPAAVIFYFESSDSLLLYNSGYNPEQKYYSGGLLLVSFLIRQAIENKRKVFDFLRGNERYKYDLGGKDVNLYKFVCNI